jgi:subtilisin family serine protease
VLSTSIKYAVDNGADVISMSYGIPYSSYEKYFEEGVNYAYDNDVVLVAAAGNTNKDKKLYPAAMDKVMAIAATNQNDERCTEDDWDPNHKNFGTQGSHYGMWIDVAAPGSLIYAPYPTYHVYWNDKENYMIGNNYTQNYGYFWGTSCATPHVAGLAALLLSDDPSLTFDEVREIIRANVDPYTSEYYIGTGRINAYKALTRYNTQPDEPETPSGRTNGRPGREYTFTTSATDEDGDELWYSWDWGDGNYSEWLGPYISGEECETSYTWEQEANFSIKVKVKDGKGGESYWSEEFIFSTPKSKILDNNLFERLIQRFPILEFLI